MNGPGVIPSGGSAWAVQRIADRLGLRSEDVGGYTSRLGPGAVVLLSCVVARGCFGSNCSCQPKALRRELDALALAVKIAKESVA